jgi:hypothetical protein
LSRQLLFRLQFPLPPTKHKNPLKPRVLERVCLSFQLASVVYFRKAWA